MVHAMAIDDMVDVCLEVGSAKRWMIAVQRLGEIKYIGRADLICTIC
jgi:hypothetical protein